MCIPMVANQRYSGRAVHPGHDRRCFAVLLDGHDVMVQLTVDHRTAMVSDFEVPQGSRRSPEELQEIGNLVLFSTFTPATAFGQPVTGKIWSASATSTSISGVDLRLICELLRS